MSVHVEVDSFSAFDGAVFVHAGEVLAAVHASYHFAGRALHLVGVVVVLGVLADGGGFVFHRHFLLCPLNSKPTMTGAAMHRAHTHTGRRRTHRMGVVLERHCLLVLVVLLLGHHHGHTELVL